MRHRVLGIVVFVSICAAASAGAQPRDPIEAQAFIDGLMQATLESFPIAGATVSLVKDGVPIVTKGYGYADLTTRRRVVAEHTLFRIGSISKLFVWTAVMQLVEQGKLDLRADVNTYLGRLKVPATYPEPVTLTHLMTHTAGFEDQVIGLFAKAPESRTLEQILLDELPARVRAPGSSASYSNHGTGLAALIVERVSGQSWNDYVEANILGPLKMTRTTFRQPVPAPLSEGLSRGYRFSGGEANAQSFEYIPLAPVGAASATATDMANFMIAHLHRGRFGEGRILGEATAETMQRELFSHAPEMNPMRHGFMDVSVNGQQVIGHGGATFWFHSLMVLLPEHDLGFFVSVNTDAGQRAILAMYQAFMNHYFAQTDPQAIAPADATKLARFAGVYRANRYSHRTLARLGALLSAVDVTVTGQGRLETRNLTAFPGGRPVTVTEWVQTGSLAFRELHGARMLAFREDERGVVSSMFLGTLPIIAFERTPGVDSRMVHFTLALCTMILSASTVVFWPAAALVRRRYRVTLNATDRLPRLARWTLWTACLLTIVFVVILAGVLAYPQQIAVAVPVSLKVGLGLQLLGAALAVGTAVGAAASWWMGWARWWGRLTYTIVALVLVAWVWQLYYWNLLGFRY